MEREIAIVAEGGGQRGIYTAGVLDAFQEKCFNPFDLGCGVSAGAQNLLTYFLEQPGYAKRAIAELTARPDFLVPYRWLASRSILDLDGYFDRTVRDPEFRLPYQQLGSLTRRRCLQFVATDRDTLDPVYLEPDESTVLDYMKASSAVPFLYRSGVPFGNRILVDGGVADPLPVRHVYELGARRILLIRTIPLPGQSGSDKADAETQDPDNESLWRQRLLQARRLPSIQVKLPGKVMQMLDCHEAALRDSLAFIKSPPPDLELIVVSPRVPLKSHVFGSRSDALLEDYQVGRDDGNLVAMALRNWQSGTAQRVS